MEVILGYVLYFCVIYVELKMFVFKTVDNST